MVPDDGIDEIGGRNVVAHTLSMTGGQPYDIERDVRRVRIIRTLLAAIILRKVGYEGKLAGWNLDEYGSRLTAEWFPTTEAATLLAHQRYEASAGP